MFWYDRHRSHYRLVFLSCHELPCKYVRAFTLQGSKGSQVCDSGDDIRYESTNYLNFHEQKKRQTILLAMRLVLVLLATLLQSLFNFLNLQNLIGLYALNNIRRLQMLAVPAVYRHRRRQRRRRNQRLRYWCLSPSPQSWFEIHYNTDDYFKQQLRVQRAGNFQ